VVPNRGHPMCGHFAVTLYATLIRRVPVESIEARFLWFMAVCYGVPLVLTIVPGVLKAYGESGAWCWIIDKFNYLRFVQFYIPLWLAIVFNAYVYYVVRVTGNVAATLALRHYFSAQPALSVVGTGDSDSLKVPARCWD
jgi:hypothetical protein